jgi:hypothetical protein
MFEYFREERAPEPLSEPLSGIEINGKESEELSTETIF